MAIGRSIGRITADLELRTAQFQKGIEKVERQTRQINQKMSKAFRVTQNAVIALGGAFAAVKLAQFVTSTLRAADNIGKLSQRLGISTQALSEYQVIADLTGVSFQTLTLGLQRSTRRISEAAIGTGEAKGALKELGLEAARLNQLAPDKQFEALAEALLKVKNPADQVRLAMKLFDSEGVSLLQTIKGLGGKEGIEGLREKLRRMGVSLDEDAAQKAAEARDQMTLLGAQFEVLTRNLAIFLAGPSAGLLEWLNKVIVRSIEGTNRILEFFGAIAEAERRELEKAIADTETRIGALTTTLEETTDSVAAMFGFTADAFKEKLIKQINDARFELFTLKNRLRELNEEAKETPTVVNEIGTSMESAAGKAADWEKALADVNKELGKVPFDPGKPVAATQAIRDLLRGLGSDIDDLIENQELFGLQAEESGRKVETQFINVTETIQNRLQPVVADFYESMFGGKALNSVRDFLNSLKDMFIRVFAEIAARITINKLFGGLLGGLGISIGGSAAGGAGAALGLGGIGAALKGGASKIGGFLGIGGAAGGATAFGLGTGGVGTGGLIAGTPLGTGASISTGFGGGAAAPAGGLGGFGAFAGPLAAVGVGLAISKFGSSRSPEEVWRDMWERRVLPLVESGAAEAANIIDTTLWDICAGPRARFCNGGRDNRAGRLCARDGKRRPVGQDHDRAAAHDGG
jgi:hypothetical protein